MVKLSRFTHTFVLEDAIALYHSLRMKPVYLSKKAFNNLQEWLIGLSCNNFDSVPNFIKKEVLQLRKCKILIEKEDEDDKVLEFIRARIPKPAISVCYMILSEQCNLACKYCFLGNNNEEKRMHFGLENMSIETANKAIDYFVRQLSLSELDFQEEGPMVIFYGGEPLINFSVLIYIAEELLLRKRKEKCLKNLEMTVVTNGLLLDDEKIIKLNELGIGISISVDGISEAENSMRIDRNGNFIFDRVLEKIVRCQELKIDISLSITLTEETIKNKDSILELVHRYGIKSIGFNIMMSNETFKVPDSYNDAVAQFIIDEFIELRKIGIYEDRIMRKVDSFVKAQVYYSDCAATSGGQIVIAPNGQVGICHGCLYDKKYFVSDVKDSTFDCRSNNSYIEWSQITPVNREECLTCSALGICGGGCPLNAMYLEKGNTIHSIDTRFCSHSKKTLAFLINDLYRIIKERKEISEK